MNVSDYNAPPTAPSRRPYVSRAIGTVLIIVLVALAAYGAYRYYPARQEGNSGSSFTSARITLSPDSLPAHDALLADFSKKQLVPDHIPSQGTQNLYAEALTKDAGYYLITGPEAGQSTLYKLDLKDPNGGLQQLSTSASDKVDLSINEPAGVAAFTAYAKDGAPHVVAINLKSGKEIDLGEGAHASVLANGSSVLFERAGALVSKEIASGKEYTLAKLPDGAPFAVDAYTSQFAFYEPSRNSIHTYQILNSGTLSQQSDSSTPKNIPAALFYLNHALYMAQMTGDSLVFSSVSGSSSAQVSAPGFSLSGFIIRAL